MHRPSSSNVASVRRENLLLSTPNPLFWIGFGSIDARVILHGNKLKN
jgi:hypothetical protein